MSCIYLRNIFILKEYSYNLQSILHGVHRPTSIYGFQDFPLYDEEDEEEFEHQEEM